jgi:hypothetical protein
MLGPKRQAQLVGEVDGCTSHGFPGAAVAVKDHASGNTLGTATCDSAGKYEVWANLDTDPQSLDVVATPAGAHAADFAGPVTQNVPTAHVGGNAVPTITLLPATNFCCGATNYYPDPCCVPDATHVCVCGCILSFSKSPTIADSLGTHTLVNTAANTWRVDTFWTVTTFDSSCLPTTTQLQSRYILTVNCTNLTWRLQLSWSYRLCAGVNKYADVFPVGGTTVTLSDTIAIDCSNNTMLTFNLPATSLGMATPGGGGTLAVVF